MNNPKITRSDLDLLYSQYHRRELVHPDPLAFLYRYPDIRDREIAGLLASCLAYGRVLQIYKSLSFVLEKMGASPFCFINKTNRKILNSTFAGFSHRFATCEHLVSLLIGIKDVIERYDSLHACFTSATQEESDTVYPAIVSFVSELTAKNPQGSGHLVPLPERGSACKRLNLFLRWMVRKDEVDPGGWNDIPASKLIIPLDVHIHRMSLRLGLTKRKQADMRTALEITDAFRDIVPEDPLRYDFTLCRMGMNGVPFFDAIN